MLLLAGAVVKTAAKIWLRDHPFAETVASDLTDLLARKIPDPLRRHRAKLRFEEFQEVVAERTLGYLGHEFAGLPAGEREAAVLAVADTLDRAAMTDAKLFEGDLDPGYLERAIRETTPGMDRDLGDAGRGLYDRLLTEACAYVISVTVTLPTFTSNALTELLRRDTVIIDKLEELLRRIPEQAKAGTPADDADARFTTTYLRRAAERWDQLRLYGTDVLTRRYPLSVAYLSLHVAPTVTEDEPARPDRRPVEAALASGTRMLIRGLAGSGKTTLLHWIAVRAAQRDFPSPLGHWNTLVPFFVPLREYVDADLPDPAGLVRHTGPLLPAQAPTDWAAQVLADGRGLVLIDGADELPGNPRAGERVSRREAARLWLERMITDFPNATYVVTSRPTAVDAHWLAAEGFAAADLQPLSADEIAAFIAHWHAAVRSETAGTEERERLNDYERRLTATVLGEPALRALAATPLLCALLCALHRDRNTALPRERLEVYEAALNMLLDRRDIERGIPTLGADLSRAMKRLLLQDLAYYLFDNDWSSVTQYRATQQVERSLSGLSEVSGSAHEVFRTLLARSGLLHAPSAHTVGFVHRTFLEYLAAGALVRRGGIGTMIKNAHDDQWREVISMAAGPGLLAGSPGHGDLITGLLDRAERETPRTQLLRGTTGDPGAQARILITALASLRHWPHLDEALAARLRRQAYGTVIPPLHPQHADALAAAGDFGMELLLASPPLDARAAAHTVMAAGQVGSAKALEVIERVCRTFEADSDGAALGALMDAWPRFDPEEYARRVLSGTSWGRRLRIFDPRLAPALHHIAGLRSLTWIGATPAEAEAAVASIGSLTRLTDLRVDGLDPGADLAPLAGLRTLETLALGVVTQDCLRHLADLPLLRDMSLRLPTGQDLVTPTGWPAGAEPAFPALEVLRIHGAAMFSLRMLLNVGGFEPPLTILVDRAATIIGADDLPQGFRLIRR